MTSLLILLLVTVIFVGLLYFWTVSRIKARHNKLYEYSDEINENLRKSGADTYYDSLDTEQLKKIYKELNNEINTVDYQKDSYKLVEIGCREKLIEDIFNKRGIAVPEISDIK